MMNRQRVVVTGMGTVNPLGSTVSRFWERCVKGASGVGTVTAFPIPEHMSRIAGMVQGPGEHELRTIFDDVDEAARLDRSLVFALLATRSAICDAGLGSEDLSGDGPARNAVVISTAIAQIARMELAFCRQTGMGSRPIGPPRSRTKGGCNNFFFNTTSGELARFFGINGRAVTTATGCTGGVDALGHAFQLIRSGKVELVIAGAAEAPITPLVVAAFSKIGATSLRNHAPAEASRPFDRDRDGFVLAEGCAIVVLESLEHALERGARIYAEITGFSSVNNHYHMTDIPEDGSSIARSCSAALADAGIDAEAVDFVNAHGSSTPQNDVAEANALRLVFGERSRRIPVTSVKSQTGHGLSAANSIELVASVLTIRDGVIPPTINLEVQDEHCPLDVVANEARPSPVGCVVKISSGFSGIHSAMIIERYNPVRPRARRSA